MPERRLRTTRFVRAAMLVAFVAAGCAESGERPPTSEADGVASRPATAPTPAAEARPRRDADVLPDPTEWLRSRQAPDGSWDGDVATTALALLAFSRQGYTHQSGGYRDEVKRAWTYLRGRQDADGCFGPRTAPRWLGDHALAALAVCEMYGMTQTKPLADPARRGVEFALATRSPTGGWVRTMPGAREIDVETTGWMVMLLKSATIAEVGDAAVCRTAIAEAVADLDRVTDPVTGRVAGPAGGPSTAMALLARIFAGRTPKDDPLLRPMADAVLAEPPALGTATDVLRTYLGTMAIYEFGGPRWKRWNEPMLALLLERQRPDPGAPQRVCWESTGDGTAAGSVRTTAFCCLMLGVYYRIGDTDGWRIEKWNE